MTVQASDDLFDLDHLDICVIGAVEGEGRGPDSIELVDRQNLAFRMSSLSNRVAHAWTRWPAGCWTFARLYTAQQTTGWAPGAYTYGDTALPTMARPRHVAIIRPSL